MSEDQTTCAACGRTILALTAKDHNGRCIPCAKGTRAQIEEGRKRYYEEKARRQSPSAVFWRQLVGDVFANGIQSVAEPLRFYFAIGCLQGEVFNGGFHQYFSNSAADDYETAERGLAALDATRALQLLRGAKELLMGPGPVPPRDIRNQRLDAIENDEGVDRRLQALDAAFSDQSLDEDLGQRLDALAERHGFPPPSEA